MIASGNIGAGRRPRVLFLGHGAELTGPPIMLGYLLRGLSARGFELSVVTERGGPLLDEYRRVAGSCVTTASGREPLETLSAMLRRLGLERSLPWLHRQWRAARLRPVSAPDLVYVNAATPPTAALLRSLDPSPTTPVVLHVHELDIGLRMTLEPADRQLLFGRADRVIAASGAVARLLVDGHGLPAERITTCPEFVDLEAIRPEPRDRVRAALGLPADGRVIGFVGLPDWRKAPELLVWVAAWIRSAAPGLDPWVVWIGGEPDSIDGQRLADEARRVGLADRVVHVGHRRRPSDLLAALDVFAMPSREDALPLAALEAAASGLPLVCFRTGGVADLCDAGAGVAVDYPDVPAFAEAVIGLLLDERRRREVGARAAEIARRDHGLEVGAARIEEVIASALDGTGR